MMLNEKQTEVKELVKATLTAWKAGGRPEQILVLVHGPSGTGKTTVLDSIATLFDDMDSAHLLLKASASEGAANKLGGTYLSDTTMDESTFAGKQFILIDDCSCLSASQLQMINELLWDPNDVVQDIIPFGGRNVILFGDFSQHPPVVNRWDTLWWPNYKAQSAIQPFMQSTIVLDEDMTTKANDWVQLTRRVRGYAITDADVAYLNGLVKNELHTHIADGPWTGALVITSSATKVHYWNVTYASCVSRASNKRLYISRSRNEVLFGSQDRINAEDFPEILKRLKAECALVRTLYIFEGMPVTVLREGKGKVWGHVKHIVLDNKEDTLGVATGYRLQFAIKEVTVEVALEVLHSNPDLDPLLVVRPITVKYTISNPSDENRTLTVERTQVPVIARFAIVESETIGVTYPRVLVDTHEGLHAFKSPYMVLTRVAKNGQLFITSTVAKGEKILDEVAVEDVKQAVAKLEGGVYTPTNV